MGRVRHPKREKLSLGKICHLHFFEAVNCRTSLAGQRPERLSMRPHILYQSINLFNQRNGLLNIGYYTGYRIYVDIITRGKLTSI